MSSEVPGRRNGFTVPFSKPQIAAWFVLLITILQFLFFVSPILPLAASIPVTIVFFVFIGGILYYGGLTQAIDPMDAHLRKFLADTLPDEEAKLTKFYHRLNPMPTTPLPDEPMKQCWLCDTQVAEPSMHCKFCNKCVKNFDHHCMWLNTCIGRENYNYFFRTMLCIFIMQILHIIVQIYLVVDISQSGPTYERANAWFNAGAAIAVEVVLIFFTVFDGVSVFLIGQLLWFHFNLQREGLTTYSYIVRESNKRREMMRVQGEIRSKRVTQIALARQAGKSSEVLKLKIGGVCRMIGCAYCDPVQEKKKETRVSPQNSTDAEENGNGTPPPFSASLSTPAASNNATSPTQQSSTMNGMDKSTSRVRSPSKRPDASEQVTYNASSNGGGSNGHMNGASSPSTGRSISIGVGDAPNGGTEMVDESTTSRQSEVAFISVNGASQERQEQNRQQPSRTAGATTSIETADV